MNSYDIGTAKYCSYAAFKKHMTTKVLCIVLLVLGRPNDNVNYARDSKGMETCLRLFLNCNARLQQRKIRIYAILIVAFNNHFFLKSLIIF